MEIKTYRQAVVKALKWLMAQQQQDGSFKPLEHGLGTIHKVPYALAVTGQLDRGARLCAWIQENMMDEEGDFTRGFPREGPMASFYHYPNSWLVMGAHRLGQFGLSLRAAEFLATLQHPQTGGFLTAGPASSLEGMQDIMSTAVAGLAMLHTGRLAEAEAAGKCLLSFYERQPRLNSQLLFVQQRGERLVTDWEDSQAPAFALTVNAPKQWFFVPGLAAGFLAKLYEVTAEAAYLQAAQNYIQFANTAGAERYDSPNSWWFGWGAALVYAASGVAAHRQIVEAVAQQIVESQLANGAWSAGTMSYEPPAPLTDATAEAIICLTEIIQALVIAE